MKKIVLFFLLISICFLLFAETEIYDTLILKTEYFDIIYDEPSMYTANLLLQNADNYYKEICEKLGTEPSLRMPITICSDVSEFNAHYAWFPFPHIVVYDTGNPYSDLACFDETVLSVFYHELVHAVSLSINSSDLLNMEIEDVYLLGRGFSTNLLTLPQSFIEGVTVSFESAKGEGRLNNGYTLFELIEARLEDKFPSFIQASGVGDYYLGMPNPYHFGGAFSAFLQNKYGLEKYAEFFDKACDFPFSVNLAFKKTFNANLNDEWELFEQSIPILPINTDVKVDSHTRLGSYSSLTANNNSYAYISYTDEAVYLVKNGKQTKLFSTTSDTRSIKMSYDGKYLAVEQQDQYLDYQIKVFDIQKKSFIKTIKGIRNANFYTAGSKTFLVALEQKQQSANIVVYDLAKINDNEFEKENEISFLGYEIYSIASGSDNQFAFIAKKDGLLQLIVRKNDQTYYYDLPKDIITDSFDYVGNDKYIFSYAKKEYSIPRLGFIQLSDNNALIQFQNEDIKGGVFNPIVYDGSYYFISKYTKAYQVSSFSTIPGGLSEPILLTQNTESKPLEYLLSEEEIANLKMRSFTYTDEKYAKQAFIPFPLKLKDEDPGIGTLGLSFLSQDAKEQFITISGFYSNIFDFETKSFVPFNFNLYADLMNSTTQFGYEISIDKNAWGIEEYLVFNQTFIQTGTNNYLQFLLETFNSYKSSNNQFINIAQIGAVVGSKYLSIGAEYIFGHNNLIEHKIEHLIGGIVGLNIPQLLPFKNPLHCVYNWPTIITVGSFWDYESQLALNLNTTLVSQEIQNGFVFARPTMFKRYVLELKGSLELEPKQTVVKNPKEQIEALNKAFTDPIFKDRIGLSTYLTTGFLLANGVALDLNLGAQLYTSILNPGLLEFSIVCNLAL